tara:strand:- start:316 stop:504 length:189 start_codon:yes stop_codon:yes gene_type:complete
LSSKKKGRQGSKTKKHTKIDFLTSSFPHIVVAVVVVVVVSGVDHPNVVVVVVRKQRAAQEQL